MKMIQENITYLLLTEQQTLISSEIYTESRFKTDMTDHVFNNPILIAFHKQIVAMSLGLA